MAKKEEEKEKSPEPNSELDNIPLDREYLELSQQAAVRNVVLPESPAATDIKARSLTEAMDEATDLTDMQFAMAKEFPKDVKVDDVMVGRIAPEAFLSLLQLMVTNDMMMSNPANGIDVNSLVVKNYIKLTIGLDGKGRIDIAELLGAAREIKREESLLKGL